MREALKHLKAVTEAFGPDEGVEFDQKSWSALHAAIKEALAQPEQEPVYWQWRRKDEDWQVRMIFSHEVHATTEDSEVRTLHTTPPQRKPLTDEQRCSIVKANCPLCGEIEPYGIIDDVEAAHGIKE